MNTRKESIEHIIDMYAFGFETANTDRERRNTDYHMKEFLKVVCPTWCERKKYYKIYVRLKQ